MTNLRGNPKTNKSKPSYDERTIDSSDDLSWACPTLDHEQELDWLQVDKPQRRQLVTLSSNDVQIGQKLGSGTFSEVFNVALKQRQASSRNLARQESSKGLQNLYALKSIRAKTRKSDNDEQKRSAVIGAYLEAEILAQLPLHPNIVSLVAVSDNFWDDPLQGFLVFDKVTYTLDSCLRRWSKLSKIEQQEQNIRFHHVGQRKILQDKGQQERIKSCGLPIARAMAHLHKHSIVHRDLKPQNVGFGVDGHVKLLDFGLAKRITSATDRCLTKCGTELYMAPEVAQELPYSFPADVYSFGILLWEICSLTTVVKRFFCQRPSLRGIMHPLVSELLECCWEGYPSWRPDFPIILQHLEITVEQES